MVDIVERDFHSELIEHGKINHEQLLVMNAWREEMWRLRAQLKQSAKVFERMLDDVKELRAQMEIRALKGPRT
jgi:hypothetical protein